MICQDCDGLGSIGLWVGHGGSERHEGDMERCETCGGSGETEAK